MEGMRLRPLGTIRHSGFLRVANLGSVRVEATNVQGLTQLSPDQYPGEAIDARQAFVYRFPSSDYAFTLLSGMNFAFDGFQVSRALNQLLGPSLSLGTDLCGETQDHLLS